MATDPPIDLPDMTAAELALGVLDGDERAAAVRRQLAEPDFAQEVEAWRTRFAALFAYWPDSAPPADVEQRVMAAIDPRPAPALRRFWPGALAGAIAATLVMTVAVLPRLHRPVAPVVVPAQAPPPPLLAAIALTSGGTPVAAAYDRVTGVVRLAGTVTPPRGHSAELWAINGKDPPRPVGLLGTTSTRIVMATTERNALVDGTVLAISIEPMGGSRTGLPTGPVVATGALAAA